MANITLWGGSYPGVPALDVPQTGGGKVRLYECAGIKQISQNGLQDVTGFASVDVNVQGGGSGYTRTVIVPQQSVSGQQPTLTHTGVLVAEEYYVVTIDGAEYICTAKEQWNGAAFVIGDLHWYYGTPGEYNYPFVVGYEVGTGLMDCVISGSGSHTVKVERLELTGSSSGGGAPNLQQKTHVLPSETSQTIEADPGFDGLESVQIDPVSPTYVGSGVTRKAAATIHPSASDQAIAADTYLTGAQTVKGVQISNLTPENIRSGVVVKVGDSTDDDCVAAVTGSYEGSGGGSGKAAQAASGVGRATTSTYTAVGPSLTVEKTGTYDVYWCGYRSSTSGTSGSQLYIGNTAYGSAQTTFQTGSGLTNIQLVHLTNVPLTAGQVLTIRARSRGNNYYMYIMNLVIIET